MRRGLETKAKLVEGPAEITRLVGDKKEVFPCLMLFGFIRFYCLLYCVRIIISIFLWFDSMTVLMSDYYMYILLVTEANIWRHEDEVLLNITILAHHSLNYMQIYVNVRQDTLTSLLSESSHKTARARYLEY